MVQGVLIEDGCLINRNPATGELIEKVCCTKLEEVPTLVQTAQRAQKEWFEEFSLEERIGSLKKGCAALECCLEELSSTITKEMGKPLAESVEEVEDACGMDSYLDLIKKANEDEAAGLKNIIVRDPHGVVVILAPWNFPCGEIILLVLPALAAGNTAIVKPSEVSPLSGAITVQTIAKFLPPGVLQLAQGDGEIGDALVKSDIDMVAMTGSSTTGRNVMSVCSSKLNRVVLELGGKDPMIVFADADLNVAAKDAVTYSLFNAGQVCSSVERVYVDVSVKDQFEQKVIQLASQFKVGDGRTAENTVGPLVSKMQRERVAAQVDAAIADGGRLLYKSDVPTSSDPNTSFYPVTVLTDVKQEMDIQRLETFGPVVSISYFDGTEQEAVSLANDTEYGLASYVYTKDLDKATRVARRIRSGQVGINCYSMLHMDIKCPWVGHKSSGFGFHSGIEGFRQFSVPKSFVYSSEL